MRSGRAGGLSRRGFLIAGSATAVVAAAGSGLAMKLSLSEEAYREIAGVGPDPLVLNWKGLAVMTQVADLVVAPGPEMPTVLETMTARRVDRELHFGGDKLQADMKASLGYLEVLPGMKGDLRPFSALPHREQLAVLRVMSATAGTDRSIYLALKFFSGLFYFSDDRSWDAIGYGGPGVPEKLFEAGTRIANIKAGVGGMQQ